MIPLKALIYVVFNHLLYLAVFVSSVGKITFKFMKFLL